MNGYFNKILLIDLTDQSYFEEVLSGDIYKKYLGGKGLATHLLFKEPLKRTKITITEPCFWFCNKRCHITQAEVGFCNLYCPATLSG